jgi:uncharacterized surface protein with fasciclin (FAS1) repeats
MKIRLISALAIAFAGGAFVQPTSSLGHSCGDHENAAAADADGDIIAVATGAGNFTTLVKAIRAAGLVETLQGPGPFTVFAPTDEAFAKLPDGTLEALLADKEKLVAVLTYHVAPGKLEAAELVKVSEVKMVQGQALKVGTADGVTVDNASVVKTDIAASNGVIHVIDTVVIPN